MLKDSQGSKYGTLQPNGDEIDQSIEVAIKRVGPYELIRELGRGAMGTVYQAKHVNLQRVVALKVLSREMAESPERLERFRREMQAIGRLEHPNIVLATDAGDFDGVPYIAMQFVDGADVEAIASGTGPFKVADACEIIRQSALGLQHVLEHGLVHRDIKPSNLLLTKNGEVKLLDLGIAMLRDRDGQHTSMTAANALMGTPDYIAPEQINQCHRVDIRADIYSLGCTLYTLLSGQAPFSGPTYTTYTSKLLAHAERQPEPLLSLRPDIPKKLVQIVDRMMAKSADDRYSEPRLVAEAMADWIEGADLRSLIRNPITAKSDKSSKKSWSKAGPVAKSKGRSLAWIGLLPLLALLYFVPWPKFQDSLSVDSGNRDQAAPLIPPPKSAADSALQEPGEITPSQTTVDPNLRIVTTIASSIDDSTKQIARTNQSIDSNTQKIEENTGKIAQSLDELMRRLSVPQSASPIPTPQSPGEHYYNALAYSQMGNQRAARQSFIEYFRADMNKVDPHLKFIEFLKLQEGISGAREIYQTLPGERGIVSRVYAEAMLTEPAARQSALEAIVAKHDDFAPAWYQLSQAYGTARNATQTLFDKSTEKRLLEGFLDRHSAGHLIKYFIDQAEVVAIVQDAQQRLELLKSVRAETIEKPVSLTLPMKLPTHWIVSLDIAEAVKEIQFRIGDQGEFVSTGNLTVMDPATGTLAAKNSFELPISTDKVNLWIRYKDAKDHLCGPFEILFDAQVQQARWERYSIDQTKRNWLRLSDNRLYFDLFQAGRSVIAEVRYSIDSDKVNLIKAVPKFEFGPTALAIAEYSEVIQESAKYAAIQVTFRDGTQSEVVKIDRR